MFRFRPSSAAFVLRWCILACLLATPVLARAVPAFARQTGQQCTTCHAGGQFPELTPFGRLFKLTGYTIGQRQQVPLSAMAIASYTETRNTRSDAPSLDFPKEAVALFQTASVFAAGKITDHAGYFAQLTYDNYAQQDPVTQSWSGHTHADNVDVRYARQLAWQGHDLVAGLTLNNNPSVADVWNTVPAWAQYVPTAFGFTGPPADPVVASLGQQVVGVGGYVLVDQTVYVELEAYRSARGVFSALAHGVSLDQRLRGGNPYFRIALTHDWGPHSAMIGAFALNADVMADPANPAGPDIAYRDRGVDAQYQFLDGEHAATAQFSYVHETARGGDAAGIAANGSNTLNALRLRASYVYRQAYGAALGFLRTSGSADALLYPGVDDSGAPIAIGGSAANRPDTRAWVPELFWVPLQNLRVGAQFYRFDRYNGSGGNYDGAGRNARDNNTLFVYLWGAY